MELKRYDEVESFPFGNLEIRDMTPSVFRKAKMAQVEVPIGADNPPYAAVENEKVYVGISGDIEFKVGEKASGSVAATCWSSIAASSTATTTGATNRVACS